jgi:hypothetical protein
MYIPEITLLDIEITPNIDYNTVSVNVNYRLNISGQQDNIIIELQ